MFRSRTIALFSPMLLLNPLPYVYAQQTDETASETLIVTSDRLTDVAPQSYRAQHSSLASKQPVSFLEEARTVESITAVCNTPPGIPPVPPLWLACATT